MLNKLLSKGKAGFYNGRIFSFVQFHLLLNVAVGGGYFGDNAQYNTPKPWHGGSSHPMRDFWEHRGDWLPTWHGDDVAMLIDYVEMIQY